MSANRIMLQYEEKLRREENGKKKWEKRYYTPPEVLLPTNDLGATIAITVIGHPLESDG